MQSPTTDRSSLSPETLVQYRCQECGEPITDKRPGTLEVFTLRGTKRRYPQDNSPEVVFQHHACRERADDTYALELPEQCATLGTEARPYAHLDSVAENKEGFAKKQWGAPVVKALDDWEPREA